jgi:hypothetical protein
MLQIIRRALNMDKSTDGSFEASTIHQLDKARTILTNARQLDAPGDIKRSVGYALEEIDVVFRSAKKRAAELQGMDGADVE